MAITQSADPGRQNLSISATNSNGAGDAWGLVRGAGQGGRVSKVTMQVTEVNGGAYSALSMTIDASIDGTNWVTLDVFVTALGANATDGVSAPTEGFNYFRANKVSSATSAGTPKVTANLSFGA